LEERLFVIPYSLIAADRLLIIKAFEIISVDIIATIAVVAGIHMTRIRAAAEIKAIKEKEDKVEIAAGVAIDMEGSLEARRG